MKSIVFFEQNKTISAERFPNRKGVYLCISTPGEMKVYARFTSSGFADKFMDELAELVHAVKEEEQ